MMLVQLTKPASFRERIYDFAIVDNFNPVSGLDIETLEPYTCYRVMSNHSNREYGSLRVKSIKKILELENM